MQARTYRDVAYFDRAVRQLRTYFGYLEREATRAPAWAPRVAPAAAGRTTRKRKSGRKQGG